MITGNAAKNRPLNVLDNCLICSLYSYCNIDKKILTTWQTKNSIIGNTIK
mgnify:CR=1 FL=1